MGDILHSSIGVARVMRPFQSFMAGFAVGLIVIEVWRPLRRPRESRLRRAIRNLSIGGAAAVTVQVAELPIVMPLARYVERRRIGVVPMIGLRGTTATFFTLVALDYTLYWWHVLVHRVPGLWRFHAVHHADRDLDTLTAIRFHFGELVASVPWRVAQVLAIGATPSSLMVWQGLTMASVLFHHSNVRLPPLFERVLGFIVVTPRLHGIHHSRVGDHTNSNWSSGLSVWDRLHGTFRDDIPQHEISVGVDGLDRLEALRVTQVLSAPFTRG